MTRPQQDPPGKVQPTMKNHQWYRIGSLIVLAKAYPSIKLDFQRRGVM